MQPRSHARRSLVCVCVCACVRACVCIARTRPHASHESRRRYEWQGLQGCTRAAKSPSRRVNSPHTRRTPQWSLSRTFASPHRSCVSVRARARACMIHPHILSILGIFNIEPDDVTSFSLSPQVPASIAPESIRCVCVCVCVCLRACVRACVGVCACVWVYE